jgi:hypothetical protein
MVHGSAEMFRWRALNSSPRSTPVESGDNLWTKQFDAFVMPLTLRSLINKDPMALARGAGMKSIDWRSSILRCRGGVQPGSVGRDRPLWCTNHWVKRPAGVTGAPFRFEGATGDHAPAALVSQTAQPTPGLLRSTPGALQFRAPASK